MYIDAIYVQKNGCVTVLERTKNSERKIVKHPVDYSFYVPDKSGPYKNIYGKNMKKITAVSSKEKLILGNAYPKRSLFEFDENYLFRTLEQNYNYENSVPSPHVAFFDIETDFDRELGYSSPAEARCKILSFAVYQQWTKSMICLALPPPSISWEKAQEIADSVGNVILFDNEAEMLLAFLEVIKDADVLSAWNGTFYDIPYTVNRIKHILGKHETKKLCLLDQYPRERDAIFGGKTEKVYDLVGRVHLDYLELYKKYNYDERYSYALDNIAEIELGEKKVQYDGTLDALYNNDFQLFLEYNIQDTMLLDKLDLKLKFIDLIFSIAHSNCVLTKTALGTVTMAERAIIIEAHSRGFVLPDRYNTEENSYIDKLHDIEKVENVDDLNRAAGGWVGHPKKGLHQWVAMSDLNSLYPNVIRAFNMSPETLVGQIDTKKTDTALFKFVHEKKRNKFSMWWNDRFNILEMESFYGALDNEKLIVDFVSGERIEVTGKQLKDWVFDKENNVCITANGTIFKTDMEGIIPSLLSRWYSERKKLKNIRWNFSSILGETIKAPETYDSVLETLDTEPKVKDIYDFKLEFINNIEKKPLEEIIDLFNTWGLRIHEGAIYPQKKWKQLWKDADAFWDKSQLVKKILLNSAYGAILNKHFKFYDKRIGQSVTLSGRSITRHMTAKTNELLCGVYDHQGKCIIYGDTDSVMYSIWPEIGEQIERGDIEWDKELAVELYDQVSDEVSSTFPKFLNSTFNVPEKNALVIRSAREAVATNALFIKKKRYACLLYIVEDNRMDVDGKHGKLKAMGLDLRRVDTPKIVQEVLVDILNKVLLGEVESKIINDIINFKNDFKNLQPWQKGIPKAVNNMTAYTHKLEEYVEAKITGLNPPTVKIPGHVQASINWNKLKDLHNDQHSVKIVDGHKVVVCYVKDNPYHITNIAFPVEQNHLPKWFTELPFDEDDMMYRVVDKKIENLLGVLDWDLTRITVSGTLFDKWFS